METLIKKIVEESHLGLENIWPKEYLQIISCPLCKSSRYKHLYPKKLPRLVICLSCNFIYTNPRLKRKYLPKLYTKYYFQNKNSSVFGYHNYLADKEKIRKTFSKRLKDIEKLQKKGKLLDVGCATGFFMKTAEEHGWKPEGVEISKFASDYAKKYFHLKVHNMDMQDIDFPLHTFDLITLWDIIEHLSDPIDAMKRIHRILKNDGLLVLSTPDVGSIPAKITKHNWVGYKLSDEHLSYFAPPTLAALLNQAGFRIVKSHHLGKYVSFPLFANRVGLYSTTLGKMLEYISKFIPESFNFYLSAFDIICIYARKK